MFVLKAWTLGLWKPISQSGCELCNVIHCLYTNYCLPDELSNNLRAPGHLPSLAAAGEHCQEFLIFSSQLCRWLRHMQEGKKLKHFWQLFPWIGHCEPSSWCWRSSKFWIFLTVAIFQDQLEKRAIHDNQLSCELLKKPTDKMERTRN